MIPTMGDTIDYNIRAQLHRPADPAVLAAEIRRLRAQGLRPRDLSVALRLPLGAVLDALADPNLGGGRHV